MTIQRSLDRIQQAAAKSPMLIPCSVTGEKAAISIVYELCPRGIFIKFNSVNNLSGIKIGVYKKVTWSEIAHCITDPIKIMADAGLEEIKKARFTVLTDISRW